VYDPAGNLQYRTNNQLTANFTVNSDNELTANTNGGKITVMGTTTSSATNVTVNLTNTAQLYGDWTFAATNFPILSSYSAVAKDKLGRVSTNTVNVDLSTDTPTIARGMPRKMIRRWERLLGYERFSKRRKDRLHQTEHPNALPASWRCPG